MHQSRGDSKYVIISSKGIKQLAYRSLLMPSVGGGSYQSADQMDACRYTTAPRSSQNDAKVRQQFSSFELVAQQYYLGSTIAGWHHITGALIAVMIDWMERRAKAAALSQNKNLFCCCCFFGFTSKRWRDSRIPNSEPAKPEVF